MPSKEQGRAAGVSAGPHNAVRSAAPVVLKRTFTANSSTTPSAAPAATQNLNPPQQLAGKPSAWANGGGAAVAQSLAKSLAKSLYNPSAARMPPSQAPQATEPSQANSAVACNNTHTTHVSPSQGPTPSAVTNNWRNAPTQMTDGSVRQKMKTAWCVLSGMSRHNFRQGEVISVPFHTANTNPNVDQTDKRLTLTYEGPTYSKRRMMVVLWIFQQHMLCLTLYSFQGRGIQAKPVFLQDEYVSMKNVGDKAFQNQGQYKPIEVAMNKWSVSPTTAVHLTGGVKVGCEEDIAKIGRITQESHKNLVKLWTTLNQAAQNEAW